MITQQTTKQESDVTDCDIKNKKQTSYRMITIVSFPEEARHSLQFVRIFGVYFIQLGDLWSSSHDRT